MSTAYAEFLDRKRRAAPSLGIRPGDALIPSQLFDWQAAITRWALRKGRAAIFGDCGLGKSYMQVAWAASIPGRVLILAPLCVAEQTVREAAKLGIVIQYATTGADSDAAITITNYERIDGFDPADYAGVVLDESSILKAFDGKTRAKLIQTFARTKYRLCCTATPSPNDISELANHAEFLGLVTRAEFLASWFVHDDAGWRMKGHAVQPFYRWLASWAIALRKPSDIGYDDTGYILPPLNIHEHVVDAGSGQSSVLFPELGLKGIGGRQQARRGSLEARLDAAHNIMGHWGESWIAWCGLNTESEGLAKSLPTCVEVSGSDSYAEKVGAIQSFLSGESKILVSKLRIAGYGMNFQHCHKMLFMGIGDSFEQYYQGIRRCHRFGQLHPVDVHIVVGDAERAVVENVRRKERQHDAMAAGLLEHMRDFEREELAS